MRKGEVFMLDLSDLADIPQPRLSEMFSDEWGTKFWKTYQRLENLQKVVQAIETEIENRT